MSKDNGNRLQSGSGILHPTKGINPRDLACPRCGKTHGTIMLGTKDHGGICGDCKAFAIGLGPYDSKCPKCGSDEIHPKHLPEDIPLPKICTECEAEVAANTAIVEAGGVLWQCVDCGSTGALEGGHPIAVDARAESGGEACLVQLDASVCPVCP